MTENPIKSYSYQKSTSSLITLVIQLFLVNFAIGLLLISKQDASKIFSTNISALKLSGFDLIQIGLMLALSLWLGMNTVSLVKNFLSPSYLEITQDRIHLPERFFYLKESSFSLNEIDKCELRKNYISISISDKNYRLHSKYFKDVNQFKEAFEYLKTNATP